MPLSTRVKNRYCLECYNFTLLRTKWNEVSIGNASHSFKHARHKPPQQPNKAKRKASLQNNKMRKNKETSCLMCPSFALAVRMPSALVRKTQPQLKISCGQSSKRVPNAIECTSCLAKPLGS